eukprot:jgi/Picsp_1/5933/NSC_03290-R1_pinus taeda anonymous locus 0_7150_01 genomic sequence
MGGLAKDATPNTCVTVCGVSGMDWSVFTNMCPCPLELERRHVMMNAMIIALDDVVGSYAPLLAMLAALDSCTEACQQTVCTSMHQVPAWNEACITRCSTECQRGRTQ